jgi:hypothetical protein
MKRIGKGKEPNFGSEKNELESKESDWGSDKIETDKEKKEAREEIRLKKG